MCRFLPVLLLGWALAASPLQAQILPNSDPGRAVRTRSDLERLLGEYEAALSSPAYSESVKRSIRADAERIRARLTEGDFRVGDRVVLDIQGEPNYPDTVVVESGPMIVLQLFGDISLAGVLRSELEDHLREALSQFIRDPIIRASGYMRLGVLGDVGGPGYYAMPAETLLGDVLMLAGGPAATADLEDIRIERGSQVLLQGDDVQEAIRSGLTLDQLNLQAGDQVVVPAGSTGGSWLQVFGIVSGIAGTIATLVFLLGN